MFELQNKITTERIINFEFIYSINYAINKKLGILSHICYNTSIFVFKNAVSLFQYYNAVILIITTLEQ